jgi:hypothetical protein
VFVGSSFLSSCRCGDNRLADEPLFCYSTLSCGATEDGKWIRIYPIPFRSLPYQEQYKKYHWVELDLVRNTSDFRPESYRPKRNLDEPITTLGSLDTSDSWQERKNFVLKEVFFSMAELIELAKGQEQRSLGVLKPLEIVDFVIEADEREWKKEWLDQLNQLSLFDHDSEGRGEKRQVVRKLPFKYSYSFLTEGDKRPRKLMIEDWEIGALYWNCLTRAGGDEAEANRQVRKKYYDEFLGKKDIHLFLGTTKQYHNVSPNPFVIVGVFYPPKIKSEPQQISVVSLDTVGKIMNQKR